MSILLAVALAASQTSGSPVLARKGDCGWVHGRYSVANGSRIHRIWVIGTHHVLDLSIPDEGASPFPDLVKSGRFVPLENAIYGDFMVCAGERYKAGHMQPVNLKAYRSIRVTTRE